MSDTIIILIAFFLGGVGFTMFFEGIVYGVSPEKAQRFVAKIMQYSKKQIQIGGLLVALLGVFMIFIALQMLTV